jgi:hypothetical protein
MATTYKPDSYGMIYGIDEVKKSFRQFRLNTYEKISFSEIIRTEKNNGYNSTTGAETLLKIRDKTNWAKCTITGLRPTHTKGFYYADLLINGKKSLFVVWISEDEEMLIIRICPQFYPYTPKDRKEIINHLIERLNDDLKRMGIII